MVTPVYRVTRTKEEEDRFIAGNVPENKRAFLIGKFIVSAQDTLSDVARYACQDYTTIQPAFLIEHRNHYKRESDGSYTPPVPTLGEVIGRLPNLAERGAMWPLNGEAGIFIVFPLKEHRRAASAGEINYEVEKHRYQIALGEKPPSLSLPPTQSEVEEQKVSQDAGQEISPDRSESDVAPAPSSAVEPAIASEDLYDTASLCIRSLNELSARLGVHGAHILDFVGIDPIVLDSLPEDMREEIMQDQLVDVDVSALQARYRSAASPRGLGERRLAEEDLSGDPIHHGSETIQMQQQQQPDVENRDSDASEVSLTLVEPAAPVTDGVITEGPASAGRDAEDVDNLDAEFVPHYNYVASPAGQQHGTPDDGEEVAFRSAPVTTASVDDPESPMSRMASQLSNGAPSIAQSTIPNQSEVEDKTLTPK